MKNKDLQKYLLISAGIHLIVFLSLFNFTSIFKKDVTLSAVRVDMQALPDLPAPKKKISKKKVAKKKPKVLKVKKKPKPKPKPKPKKETPKVDPKSKESGEDQKEKEEVKDQKIKGNQVSEGADEGSEELSSDQLQEINIYAAQVESLIKANWNLPKYLIELDLKSEVEIQINDQGEIIFKKLSESSGDEVFDAYVLKAVESAAPYPIPPSSIQRLLKGGIVFSLNSKD